MARGRVTTRRRSPGAAAGSALSTALSQPVSVTVTALSSGDAALDPAWQPTSRDVAQAERFVQKAVEVRGQIMQGFYQLGVLLRELVRPSRYRALGYASFEELLEQREITSRVTASKLIVIASRLDAASARELGMEKSYAFVRYAEVAAPQADARALAGTDPRIKGTSMRLSEISSRDLFLAARALRGGARSPAATDAEARKARGAARRLRAAFRRAGLPDADVRVHRSREGIRVVVKLETDEADALAEQL